MRGNKGSLADRVAEKMDVSRHEAQAIVEMVLDSMVEELTEKGGILLTGFGTLSVVQRSERIARNPQTGQQVSVPARRQVRFVPGVALKRHVNGEPIPGRSILSKRPRS
jgi:DNA-binding protein HU-beta